jgi:acyl-CoA synthetase (AMP-forming)/AMP-acid ligase II
LEQNVAKFPDKMALSFLGSGSNGGVIDVKMTYQEIWDKTVMLATNLTASGMKQGDMYVVVFVVISLYIMFCLLSCIFI